MKRPKKKSVAVDTRHTIHSRIVLGLCERCVQQAHDVAANGYEDGWNRLPKFCVVCAAKVAQAIRLLTLPDDRFVIVDTEGLRKRIGFGSALRKRRKG